MYMPERIKAALERSELAQSKDICEIRLYAGRYAVCVFPGGHRFLTANGRLSASPAENGCIKVTEGDIAEIVDRLADFSLHSCKTQLTEGYFVIENGIRVGVAGIFSSPQAGQLKSFSSLNFRIARCIEGCAEEVFSRTFDSGVIICGGVGSGKTTLLRDLCRLTGNMRKTALIDERNEISCTRSGEPENDVGALTDIIVNTVRSEGINIAIRTLSPDYIFCDEIASSSDAEAIMSAAGTGVRIAATIHAESYDDLLRRKIMGELLHSGVFSYAVILSGSARPSQVREIRRINC